MVVVDSPPAQGRPQAVPSLVPGRCSGDQAFAEDTHGGDFIQGLFSEVFDEDTHGWPIGGSQGPLPT